MAEQRSVIRIQDWEGLFSRQSEFEIPQGASPYLRNIEFFRDGWRSRNGYTAAHSTTLGTDPITGIFDGWNHIIVTEGTDAYTYDSGAETFTSRTSALTNNAVPSFVSYNALDIMVNGSGADAPQKWDGTTWAALGGSPPSGDTIEVFNNRVWIGGLASPNQSEVQFSDLEDPESWPGGFIRVSKRQQGHTVKGLKTVPVPGAEGGERLGVFCDDAIFHFSGFHRDTFVVHPVNSKIGCVGPQSIAVAEGITYWVDENGIYASPDGGTTVNHISWRIQPDFDSLSASRLDNCCVGVSRYKRQIWWSFSESGQNENDIIFVYNYGLSDPTSHAIDGRHVWSIYELQDGAKGLASMGEALVNGEYRLYGGDNTDGWLYRLDNGTNDDGTKFKWEHRSRKWVLDNWSQYMILRKFTAIHDLAGEATITVEMWADLAQNATLSDTVVIPAGGSATFDTGIFGGAVWGGGSDLSILETWYNRLLHTVQFNLIGDELDKQFNCYEMQFEANAKRGMR